MRGLPDNTTGPLDSQLVGQLTKSVTPHTEETGTFLLQANFFFKYKDHSSFMSFLAQHKVDDANGIPPLKGSKGT